MSNVSVIAAVEALERADLAAADTAVCADLLRHVRRARGWLDAVEARISSRARDLATITPEASGPAGTAVSDLHGAIGGTSAAEGRRRERRSKTLDETPSFADALENGRVSAEHVDALANATTGLDDAIKPNCSPTRNRCSQLRRHGRRRSSRGCAGNGSAGSNVTMGSHGTGSNAPTRICGAR